MLRCALAEQQIYHTLDRCTALVRPASLCESIFTFASLLQVFYRGYSVALIVDGCVAGLKPLGPRGKDSVHQ